MELFGFIFFGVLGIIAAIVIIVLLTKIANKLYFDKSMNGCSFEKYNNVLYLIKKDVIKLVCVLGIVTSFSTLCWYLSIESIGHFNHKDDYVIKALNNEIEYDTIALRPDGKLQEIEIRH